MTKKSNKKILFERMNIVGGMPLNENDGNVDPQKAWEAQKKLDSVYIALGNLDKHLDNVLYLSKEDKSLISWVLEITGRQIPQYYENPDNPGRRVGGIEKI